MSPHDATTSGMPPITRSEPPVSIVSDSIEMRYMLGPPSCASEPPAGVMVELPLSTPVSVENVHAPERSSPLLGAAIAHASKCCACQLVQSIAASLEPPSLDLALG